MRDSSRYVNVKDLATGGDHTPELDDVYVDVALARRAAHQVTGNPLSGIAEDATGRHSVSEFLDRRARVVLAVVGPPGCGKSTLLAHAARRSALAGRRSRRRVPVLLPLREHAAVISSDPQTSLPDVLRPAASGVPGKEPDGWWERQLRRGKCVVLLDGLDEVADEGARRTLAGWAERQITIYPGTDFVITSRPHGFPGLVIAQADILTVRPFTAEQVQLFLTRWYLAAERHATGATTKAQLRATRIRASDSASRLLALLRANPALQDLTVNPLLLTMIAMVHRYRGALPGSRADLYGEICQVMLSRRIQAKDLPEMLPWPAKYKLLTTLAYEMMLRRASDLPVRDVLEILDPLLRRLPQSVTGQGFLDDVSRNGMLVEPSTGHYAFTHLTFQEYLAAGHVSDNPRLVTTLADAVDDPWWRETTLLYAATNDSDQVVRACLDRATIPALALGFDCADTSSTLAHDLRQRLDGVRDRAFAEDCGSGHRRLIAAVLAGRLARQTITTSAGTRICDQPAGADLYWLFLQDTSTRRTDGPCEPRPSHGQPATGIRGGEARAFVTWLNMITAGSGQAEFRLPDEGEIGEQAVTDTLDSRLPESVTSLWVQPQRDVTTPRLWVRPGKPHPHLVNAEAIRQAVLHDTGNTQILVQILTATAFNTAFVLLLDRALDRVHVLDLVRAGARDLDPGLTRARDRDRDRALDRALNRVLGLDLDLDRAVGLDRVSDAVLSLGRVLGLDIDIDLVLSLDLDLVLERVCDLDLTRLRTLDRDRVHALNLGHDLDLAFDLGHDLDLARLRALVRALVRALDHDANQGLDLVRGLGLVLSIAFGGNVGSGPGVRLLDVPGISLEWITGGPLGRASREALTTDPDSAEAGQIFAGWLTFTARVSGTAQVVVPLDGSLIGTLRELSATGTPHDRSAPGWDAAAGAARLADAAGPLLSGHQHPSATAVAGIRVIALALAADRAGEDDAAAAVFRTVAATVTLLQQREQGRVPVGEAVVLALA